MINVAVLGTASIAERFIIPTLAAHQKIGNIYIASRQYSKAKSLAQKFHAIPVEGYDNIFELPVQLVYIPLPNELHAHWIKKCLVAGMHVWVEKSLATNYKDIIELNNLAQDNKLVLLENFQFRFHSQNIYVKELIQSGAMGEIRAFRSSFGFPPFPNKKNIRYDNKLGGGALLDAGAYTLKATSFILGNGFKVRSATMMVNNAYNIDIYGNAYLENQQGLTSQVSYGFDNYYQCNYEVWGSKGRLKVLRAFTAPPGFRPELIIETNGKQEKKQLPPDNHFTNILNYLTDKIENPELFSEYDDNIEQARLIHEICENAKTF
jgi:predicted dehydrogenase